MREVLRRPTPLRRQTTDPKLHYVARHVTRDIRHPKSSISPRKKLVRPKRLLAKRAHHSRGKTGAPFKRAQNGRIAKRNPEPLDGRSELPAAWRSLPERYMNAGTLPRRPPDAESIAHPRRRASRRWQPVPTKRNSIGHQAARTRARATWEPLALSRARGFARPDRSSRGARRKRRLERPTSRRKAPRSDNTADGGGETCRGNGGDVADILIEGNILTWRGR